MIEDADQHLTEWVATVLPDTAVSLQAPGELSGPAVVGLYLLDLHPSPPAHRQRRPPLEILLRYLVFVEAGEPDEAHRLLGRLLFAAMERPGLELDLEPLPAALWRAFGAIPRPSFMLRLPCRLERPADVALVRAPMELRRRERSPLRGAVVAEDNLPVAGARVELPAWHLTARTDSRGCFRFDAVPDAVPQQFRVHARGRDYAVIIEPPKDRSPVTLRINPGEQ